VGLFQAQGRPFYSKVADISSITDNILSVTTEIAEKFTRSNKPDLPLKKLQAFPD
jgi:hypothetical protein